MGLPSERVSITLTKARLKSNNRSSCKTFFDKVLQRHACQLDVRQGQGWTLFGASEYWGGYSSPVGCVCDLEIYEDRQQVTFESVVGNVKLNFEVIGMSPLEDFEDYFFEASYEFVNYSTCDTGLRRHTGPSGDGVLSFHVPASANHELPSSSGPIRCRWKIEASHHKHLYLKFRGFNASALEGTYALIYPLVMRT